MLALDQKPQNRSSWPVVTCTLALLATAVCVAGCSESTKSEETLGPSDFPALNQPPSDSRRGGTLVVLASGDVDSLDPGIAYYQFSYMVDFATQRTLVSWPTEQVMLPRPDLARGEPQVRDGGRTLIFKVKTRVRFSPPVNRSVRSQDFKYAIERGLLPAVSNGYLETYLGALRGFSEAQRAVDVNSTSAPDISGIETPDPATLILKFNQPVAATALQALSLPIGAPVPEEYAKDFDAQSPSAYADHVVGTGPYMVENDDSGRLTGYSPGQEIELVRNPNWNPATDYRPAYLDSIQIKEGYTNITTAARKIIGGHSQVNGDFAPDPATLKRVATGDPQLLAMVPLSLYRYVALNTTIPPFDDVNVRRAVAADLDRKALRLTLGGPLTGPIASHYLPPGMPGFKEADAYAGPKLDFLAHPGGDPGLAASYLRRAGYNSGKVTGEANLLMVGDSSGPGRKTAEIVHDTLEGLGFDVDLRPVSHDTMIVRFCNVPKAEVAICPNGGWLKDFNDPQTMLDANFSGQAIKPVNNPNWSEFDDPVINRAIARARLIVEPSERAKAWGAIDRRIIALAPAIPWSWGSFPSIRSSNVVNVVNAFTGNTDLSFTSLRP